MARMVSTAAWTAAFWTIIGVASNLSSFSVPPRLTLRPVVNGPKKESMLAVCSNRWYSWWTLVTPRYSSRSATVSPMPESLQIFLRSMVMVRQPQRGGLEPGCGW